MPYGVMKARDGEIPDSKWIADRIDDLGLFEAPSGAVKKAINKAKKVVGRVPV